MTKQHMPIFMSLRLTNLFQCTLKQLKQIHAFIITTTYIKNIQFSTHFLRRATEFHSMDYPDRIFSQLCQFFYPHVVLWNVMIRGHGFIGSVEKCLELFDEMPHRGIKPDSYTYPYVLNACSAMGFFVKGQNIHSQIVKAGFESTFEVVNSLLDLYVNLGMNDLGDARKVFDDVFARPVELWNKMMSLHLNNGDVDSARNLFDSMLERDVVSWNSMISGYARVGDVVNARGLFEAMQEKNVVSWTLMIGVYTSLGDIEVTRKFFDKIPCKNVVSWNSMISTYTKNKNFHEAINLFLQMRSESIEPDGFTFVSVLIACAHSGDLRFGRWIHSLMKQWSKLGVIVGTALVEMYARCGDINTAFTIFIKVGNKDVFSWNVMIKALAIHGRSREAIKLFGDVQRLGLQPNDFTISSALFACSHGGLVEEGRKIFYGMEKNFRVSPKIDHYGCFVDLLSRNGHLEEAEFVAKKMTMEPDIAIWGAMLGGCRGANDFKVAEKVIKQVNKLTETEPGVCTLLSNMYASINQWPMALIERKKIDGKSVRKQAGYSSVV